MNTLKTNVDLEDESIRARYFHEMAEDSRILELLLNTCYRVGLTPKLASKGHGKDTLAYISLKLDKDHLSTIGRLMNLVIEIPNCEFNIKSDSNKIVAELSCDSKDSEQLFTRIKEVVEEIILKEKRNYNFKVINTVYNIAKIVREVTDANVLFATNEKLYGQGKCGVSIYKDSQLNKLNVKKPDKIEDVIEKLKTKAALHIPSIFFCTFEELRNFYFELDETVYSKDIEGDN